MKGVFLFFEMLKTQPKKPIFTGGLEARLLQPWHIDLLRESKVERMYFAYDTPADFEPLIYAGKLLRDGSIKNTSGSRAKCYVLISYPGDSMERAEKRLIDTWKAGFFPYAMLFRNEKGETREDWRQFQRLLIHFIIRHSFRKKPSIKPSIYVSVSSTSFLKKRSKKL